MTTYLIAFAFNNRKKSRKSRGIGIICMRTLSEQLQAFKPFSHGLPPPKPQFAPAIVQIRNRNDLSINTGGFCQWRRHAIRLAEIDRKGSRILNHERHESQPCWMGNAVGQRNTPTAELQPKTE